MTKSYSPSKATTNDGIRWRLGTVSGKDLVQGRDNYRRYATSPNGNPLQISAPKPANPKRNPQAKKQLFRRETTDVRVA